MCQNHSTDGDMVLVVAAGHSAVSIATLLRTLSFVFMMMSQNHCALSLKASKHKIPWYSCMALPHKEFGRQNCWPGFSATANGTCSSAICTRKEFLITWDIDLSPWGLWRNHFGLECMIIFLTVSHQKIFKIFLKFLSFRKLKTRTAMWNYVCKPRVSWSPVSDFCWNNPGPSFP